MCTQEKKLYSSGHMYCDVLALISYRSTPYPSASMIIVLREYSHATLFLWSSALSVTER